MELSRFWEEAVFSGNKAHRRVEHRVAVALPESQQQCDWNIEAIG